MREELPSRVEVLGALRNWQRTDLEQANAWLEENRVLFRDAVLHDREEARKEVGRRLIRATSELN
jgi:hypothetical protein